MAYTEVAPLDDSSQYKEGISPTSKTTQNDDIKDLAIPDPVIETGPQDDTWGKPDINTWRGALYPNNSRVSAAVADFGTPAGDLTAPSEHSIVVNRATLEDSKKGVEALKKFHSLVDLRNLYVVMDGTEKGEMSRIELHNELTSAYPGHPEAIKTALENFADFSGGTDGISKEDMNREMMSAITTAIEAAGRSGQFGFAERDAIAKWAQYPGNTEEKLNDALEGTGIKAKFEDSTFKNYLGNKIPISTVTLTRNNKEIEKFAYAGGLDSFYSLLGGKQGSGAYNILDNVDPAKTFSPEMTKHLRDARDLFELLRSPDVQDGEITFKEAANNEKRDERRDHAREYLQNHFASLARRDENDSTISKSDLQNALIESLATLMKDSILRDGLQGNDLVNGMLQDAIGENSLGHSQKLQDTLNAALERYGYRTSLTDEQIGKLPDGPFTRTLSIYEVKDPSKQKDLSLNIMDHSSRRGLLIWDAPGSQTR